MGPEAQLGCAPGVVRTVVGYGGGTTPSPSYRSMGDHTEIVQVEYDPSVVTFARLLVFFWQNHDPNSAKACSRQYMSAIFYHNEEQKREAEASLASRLKFGQVATRICPWKNLLLLRTTTKSTCSNK